MQLLMHRRRLRIRKSYLPDRPSRCLLVLRFA